MYNPYGMQVTFQHLATSKFTSKGKACLTLYGRTGTGQSVAVHVHDVKPYGYVQANLKWWSKHCEQIYEYLKWFIAEDKMKGMQRYDEQEENDRASSYYRREMLRNEGWLEKAKITPSLLKVEEVSGYGIRNVHEGEPDKFLKLTAANSNILRAVVKCLRSPEKALDAIRDIITSVSKMDAPAPKRKADEGYQAWQDRSKTFLPIGTGVSKTPLKPEWEKINMFETHISSDLLYMIDNEFTNCGWLTASGSTSDKPRTTCVLDMDVCGPTTWIKTEPNPPMAMAPYVFLSYDIESQPHEVEGQTETEFPEPDRDPILSIGVCVFNMVDQDIKQYCFMWEPPEDEPCTSYPALKEEDQTDEYKAEETDVRSFTDEYEMLLAFRRFIQEEIDPDIISGYNILNFDNVYTIQRGQHLHSLYPESNKPELAWCWGRQLNRQCRLKKQYKFSNQKGGRESWECKIEGREFMDLFKIIMDDHKLRSYKLDEVAAHFLGTRKIHISYDDIPIMQRSPEGRVKLGVYCVKDAWLPCKIAIKMAKVINAILMSQVAGVSLDTILNRGQQIRTVALMLAKMKEREKKGHVRWLLPDEEDPPDTGSFEGAVVITPIPGFWDRPVVTLDFASLYPSIMRAWNMCFSTILNNPAEAKRRKFTWSPEMKNPTYRPVRTFTYPEGGKFEYVSREDDICFKTADQCRGILPEILEELHSSRKLAKRQRKAFAENSMDYAVLDGRQLALKVCMNSIYGFTGASKGFLPEKRIASAVTRAGRGMANETKFMCEDHYKEHGVKVVYGDTDSVFVHLPKSICPGETREEIIESANRIGEEMGEMCTKAFLPPNDLEFEKVYYPLLLKGKKRYAGYKFEPGLKPKLDVKGFECVRRDFAPIVSKTQKKIFVLLCEQNDIDGAVQYARQVVVDLLEGRVPVEDLILSKQLTRPPAEYKNPAPHVELAKYLQRTLPPTQAPKTGDRINYIIKPGREKMFLRSAQPQDVIDGKCSVDAKWYLDNQLRKPIQRVFDMIIDNTNDIFKVNKLQSAKVGTDSIFSSWVASKRKPVEDRKAKEVDIKRRKIGVKKNKLDIRSFF